METGGVGGVGGDPADAMFGGDQVDAPPLSTPVLYSTRDQPDPPDTIVPVTVKQIMDGAPKEDEFDYFLVTGRQVATARMCGRMLDKVEREDHSSFILDDGTGKILVKSWDDGRLCARETAALKNGDYVNVVGGLRGRRMNIHVSAYSVKLVVNYNDITHHFLYAIQVHLEEKKAKNMRDARAAADRRELAESSHPVKTEEELYQADPVGAVLAAIRDPILRRNAHGVSFEYLQRRLGLSPDVIRDAIHHHLDYGNIYTTVDEDHFKSDI